MADRGVPLSTLSPKYLHTNSTSHTWPFSAIAELIDNAYDPDVRAKQFWIDKTVVREQECLSFMDNGNGLQHETMHKMLSFGYSDKKAINGQKPIGFYGNGFKSGSMRLGKDAIVFSKSSNALCVGMLSQTYLEKIGADQIIVPVVSFEPGEEDELRVREEDKASLQDILCYSVFKTEEELLNEIKAISAPGTEGDTGTRIIIWNLRRTSTGTTEFDFETDRYDIGIPSDMYEPMNDQPQNSAAASIPQTFYSLRAFCSILYLKPCMQVMIRGQKVKTQLVKKSLAFIRKDSYKPTFLPKAVPITFGYNTKSKDQYGIMMYHKNRLIKAYERIGCQLRANNKGVGVIGVIECDFLEPTHNKQSFNETDKYRKTMTNLGTKLEEYWKEMCHRRKQEDPFSTPVEDIEKRPDQNWVQCDECLQWRKLPDGIDCKKLPDEWFCRLNPDPQYRSCQVPGEPEDSDDEQRSYHKTFKQLEREKKNQEKMRQKEEEENRKRQEQQRLDELTRENQALMRRHATLRRRLRQTPVNSLSAPSTPFTTPRSLTKRSVTRGQSSTASQDACSPSTSSGPVISGVYSLSPGNTREKRAQPATPPSTPKRPRIKSGVSDTPASVDVSPLSHTPAPVVNDDNDDDDTDDDISILETVSTPKPQKPAFDLTRVKTEVEESDAGTLLECGNDVFMDVASEASVAESGPAKPADDGTSSSLAPPTEVASITTQTEALKIKREDEESAGQSEDQSSEQRGRTSENEGKQALGTGVMHHLDRADDSEPSCADACSRRDSHPHHPDVMEVQEQQDQLLELMQATAQERDIFKEEAEELARQLQDVQSQLQELQQASVKKKCSNQASQTEESEGGTDYKSLYEKTKHKADELIQEREALLEAIETKPENGTDETAMQVDCLLRELDERNKERDGLRSQLDNLEGERANLAAECEELRLSLQEQKRQNVLKESSTGHQGAHSSVQSDPKEAGGTAQASGTDPIPNPSMSLIELRHNIGRLLVSFVPALDLNQVNYECNVIDEILEQVLSDVEAVTPARQ